MGGGRGGEGGEEWRWRVKEEGWNKEGVGRRKGGRKRVNVGVGWGRRGGREKKLN